MRRAAAMPAAPAPITTISAVRGGGAAARAAPPKEAAVSAADPERKPRRVIVMAWFPEKLGRRRNTLANLPHLPKRGKFAAGKINHE